MVDFQKSLYMQHLEEMLQGPTAPLAKAMARDQLNRWKQRLRNGQELPQHVRQEMTDLAELLFKHEGHGPKEFVVPVQDD